MPDPLIQLGPAKASEAVALAEMSRVLVEAGLEWRWRPAQIASKIRASTSEVVVARLGEQVLGFAVMDFGITDAHLVLLAVAPHVRRAGIGRALVEYLESMARCADVREISLEVREQNRGARAFYGKLGYFEVALVPRYYGGKESALRLSRRW